MTDPNITQESSFRPRTFSLVGGLALSGGLAVLAFAGGWFLHQPATLEVQVPRTPTDAELAAACAPEVQEVRDELTTAQTRVAELERDAAAKAGKVAELEDRIARGGEAGRSIRAELAQVKAELAEVKEQLVIAEAEKDRLLVALKDTQQELHETQEELVVTRDERDHAREDALTNRWNAFLADSQLEICEKGNRKKLGNCREVVETTLLVEARRDKFAHCIRSGQAQPSVHELERDAALPEFGQMIDEEQKQVRGWYVNFCDPTLPERTDAPLADIHLPPSGGPTSPTPAASPTPAEPAAPATPAAPTVPPEAPAAPVSG